MTRSRRSVLAAALALGAMSCAGADFVDDWAGTIETMPGGSVRVANPPTGLWRAENAWRLEPDLVLGSEDGDGADVFASISAVQTDDTGDVYVLDRQANDLRIFDATGRHIRTTGRSGQGPGEYTAANGLVWLSRDTLIVIDQQGNRYSVLGRDGGYVRSVRRRIGFYGWVFNGGVDGDNIYEVDTIGQDDQVRFVLLGTHVRGGDLESTAIVEADAVQETGPRFQADTVALPAPTRKPYEAFSVRTERAGMVMSVPFTGEPRFFLDGEGGVWYGHGGDPRIAHGTFQGDTLLQIEMAMEPTPVSTEEVDEWLESSGVERFRSLGGKLDPDRIPKTKPWFDAITVDDEGNVWLAVPSAPRNVVFAVLDPDGRYLGRLEIGGVARDAYIAPLVRNGRLYFVGRDELDVQRVYVYRVVKPAA